MCQVDKICQSQKLWWLCSNTLGLMGYVKDKDIMAVTVIPEVARDEEELAEG